MTVVSASPELVMSLATLSPNPFDISAEELDAGLEATAAAGYTGISVWLMHLGMVGMEIPELVDKLDRLGLAHPVAEAAFGWLSDDSEGAAVEAANICAYATAVGGRELVAVTMEPTLPPMEVTVSRFQTLCHAAAEADLGISLEFLPWSGIPDLATAWEIVERAGCDNGGIMVDTWHWLRQPGGPNADLLREIPPEVLRVVQLCDASAEPPPDMDLMTEAMTARFLPGDGAVDFSEVLGIIAEIGSRPIWFPEVFSTPLAQLGPSAMAQRVQETSQAILTG